MRVVKLWCRGVVGLVFGYYYSRVVEAVNGRCWGGVGVV